MATAAEPDAVASSSMMAIQPARVLDCERFHDQWVTEFESHTAFQCGVDPTEHRPKLDLPMIPGA